MNVEQFLNAVADATGRTPNPEQRAVMVHNDGPLQVIAGPGTGKTYALILRCLRLLCVDRVRPEAIVLTTFTHKAADELEQRLLTSLLQLSVVFPEISTIDLSRMHLGTLHSLCWDFITETPGSPYRDLESLRQLDRAFFVYTQSRFCKNTHDSETEKLFLEIASWIEHETLDKLPPRWKRVEMFNTVYERIVHDRVDRVRFADSAPFRRELIHLIEEYETALALRRFTDQTLMQQQALEVLCSQEGRRRAQDIEHVIVDEYQDTNPVQAAIYRALAARAPHHLCVVGDDDQALHRFRGGTVACMVRFEEECKKAWPGSKVRAVFLTETYRSHPAIVSWINDYIKVHPRMSIEGARVREKGPLHAACRLNPGAPAVWAIRGKKVKDVATSFAEVLRALREQEIIDSYAQCALLSYSLKARQDARVYINELVKQGFPLTFYSSFKDQLVYKQILGTILLALDRSENLMPVHFDGAKYVGECLQVARDDPVFAAMAEQIRTWMLSGKGATISTPLTTLGQYILNAAPSMDAIEKDKVAEAAARSLIKTFDSYDRIVNKGWKIQLDDDGSRKRVNRSWMEQVYYVLLSGISQNLSRREEEMEMEALPETSALTVLTIHRAKGLEFPVVAVVVDEKNKACPGDEHHLEQDIFPFRQDTDQDLDQDILPILGGRPEDRALQDIVRRHYVAYSRAQWILLLLFPDEYLESSPPAIGLGTNAAWFRKQVEEWPPRQQKKGAVQDELDWK